MSHYQGGQYQPPPQQGYYDQYNQYHQQPAQNGGYQQQQQQYGQQSDQQQQQQYSTYPGQTTYQYQPAGGAVQQPQGGYAYQDPYQPPRNNSYGQAYTATQQYNPGDYSRPPPPPQQSSYNPAAYASYGQTAPAHQTYDPAAYSASGPVDPYAYSPATYASPSVHSSAGFSPQTQQFGSPRQTYTPHQQQYSPQPPAHQYGYPTTQSPPPQQPSGYQRGPPPPPPTSQSQQYPTDPFRNHSGSVHTSRPPASLTDPAWSPSPPTHHGIGIQQSPSPNLSSPQGSTPGPTPPAHAPSRSNTLNRHPQERPLPPQPGQDQEYFPSQSISRTNTGFSRDDELALSQEELYEQVESAVMNAGRGSVGARSPSISVSQAPFQAPAHAPSFSSSRDSRASRNGVINGHLSPAVAEAQYSSDSDVEGTQGAAMLREAEAEDARRQSSGTQSRFTGLGSPRTTQDPAEGASDSDENYGNVDMTSFGGGYDVQMTYGGDPNQLAAGGELNQDQYTQPVSSQHSSLRRSHASQSSQLSRASYDYRTEPMHAFPAYNPHARVEVGGTGGFAEPTGLGRRQSYDEGDEYSLMENNLPERFPDEPPDIFFQQASTSYPSRPLPAPPYPDADTPPLYPEGPKALPPVPSHTPYPVAPDAYTIDAQGRYVPRSTSLVSHGTSSQIAQPVRSKTDADEKKLRQSARSSGVYASMDSTPATGSVMVDLPAIGKRFSPSKLGAADFKKCSEPWSLMSLLKWLLQITNPEQNTELREGDIKEALVALFTNKVPTMNIADAETLSNRVVADMYAAGTLVATEEWVKLIPGFISGVIFQLTQSGCYAPTVHDHLIPNMRCYSHLCQRTLKKVDLKSTPIRSADWKEFYGLTTEQTETRDKKEVERQYNLHEIVTSEDKYMNSLDILRVLFRDPLATGEPSAIAPKRKERFVRDVFGRLDAVRLANEEHLLPQLKYRQQEQGPWVAGFSDIFRQWVRKAKPAYVDYANDFPKADFIVRSEMDRNIEFRGFVDRARADKRSDRLSFDNYLKAPIQRLQRYPLLLSQVLKNSKLENHEKENLKLAIEEVKAMALECDARVAEQQRKIDLSDLQARLVLRPGMEKEVELNLDQFGRQLIHRGDLQRTGSNRFTWLECHALLFDHYLILAKTVAQTAREGGKVDRYDVSKLPIPMDLLTLESTNDQPIQKSSYIKGLTSSVREAAGRNTPLDPATLGRTPSNQSPAPGLQHVNTGASTNTLNTVTSLEGKDADRVLFPFRIKHLGRDSYTLFAYSDQARKDWTNKIVEAKTKHAAALHAQNAEPFRLRVMADSAFVFDAFGGSGRGVTIKGTPVDRAIKEVEARFKDSGRPGAICRARVNCATSFSTPYPGKAMVAVGTDYGVFVSELDNPRGWTRTINMARVTQVAVLEDFNLFLLISDKSLIAYHLDVVCPSERNGPTPTNDSARKAPQKLSGSRDVGFFVTGKQKDRALVFYKKRENLNSVFKVLEPVYQKSTEKKRMGMFKRGNTEFFREFDEFYIPVECTGMNLFQSSLAVSTARGFEVLTLDKKQPWSVPETKAEHVQNIAGHIKDQRALAMLRLSDQEFLLVYANCAVYVNKHGDVSRSVVMEFVGSAQAAALYGAYLVLFNDDFVEIRNAQNGRLKQIISGREIKCLDDGTNWSANGQPMTTGINGTGSVTGMANRTLKLVMQHPEMEKNQIVMELLLNENMKE